MPSDSGRNRNSSSSNCSSYGSSSSNNRNSNGRSRSSGSGSGSRSSRWKEAAMASASVIQAQKLIGERRFAEAIELLREHLATEGTDALARSWLANAYYESGNYPAAENELLILVARPQPSSRDQFTLGRALEKQGRLDEAKHWIAAAAATDPDFTLAKEHLKRLMTPPSWPVPQALQQATTPTPQQQPTAPVQAPLSELVLPSSAEQVEEYRRWGRTEWWTQNWYGLPLPVRILRAVGVAISLLVLIGLLIFIPYVFYNVFTRDQGPPPGFPSTITQARPPGLPTRPERLPLPLARTPAHARPVPQPPRRGHRGGAFSWGCTRKPTSSLRAHARQAGTRYPTPLPRRGDRGGAFARGPRPRTPTLSIARTRAHARTRTHPSTSESRWGLVPSAGRSRRSVIHSWFWIRARSSCRPRSVRTHRGSDARGGALPSSPCSAPASTARAGDRRRPRPSAR